MADEPSADSSSYPSTDACKNKSGIAPEMLAESSSRTRMAISTETRESAEREPHKQARSTRHRRPSSNRSGRRHRPSRATMSTSTYRPNYDAPAERPDPPGCLKEYRDNRHVKPSEGYVRDSNHHSRGPYSEYRAHQTNYDTSAQYGYSHENIWERGPL
jgi:hypothetical protein